MTIRIWPGAPNREAENAQQFKAAVLASEPGLEDPELTVDILYGLPLPGRQIDLIVLYHDRRPHTSQLKTQLGTPIHSFVLIVEVKQHSPDLIRFQGPRVEVRYGRQWSDATDQCDEQTWALKNYQSAPYKGGNARSSTYVQRAIWLARAPSSAFDGHPAQSSVPVHFAELSWASLTSGFVANGNQVRTLVDQPDHPNYHSIETLRSLLTHEVKATRLDRHRIDALTQTRFDAEKTAYIRELGSGLLILRGRGGTGKTFSLMQIAFHLARQGKSSIVLTYNHGLIADISRALRLIGQRDPSLRPLPQVQTRYTFIQSLFTSTFGRPAEQKIKQCFPDIDEREAVRLQALSNPNAFLDQDIPGIEPEGSPPRKWRSIANQLREPTSEFDFVFIDEGQDWTDQQRDLMYKIFGPEKVVVTDGVDQFVGQDRCNWDRGDIPINRRHGLRSSRRTKAATCQTVAHIARELGVSDWDLVPDPAAHGGRFTVIVEPNARRAVERGLEIIENDIRQDSTLKAIDNLICLPSPPMAHGVNYPALFDEAIETRSGDSWRGFDSDDRRIYPIRDDQLRSVLYNSCRGMEGWTTLCLGLDVFFDFQIKYPRIDVSALKEKLREKDGFLYSEDEVRAETLRQAKTFATNWLMIPLTRSMDHLVLHLTDESSELGRVLSSVRERYPGMVEWISP